MLNIINGGEIVNILNEKDMYGLLVKNILLLSKDYPSGSVAKF